MRTPKPNPPRLTGWLLRRVAGSVERNSIVGDLEEEFISIAQRRGMLAARFWYLRQFSIVVPAFIWSSLYWSCIMLGNYLKMAIRTIRRHKLNSTITIAGLAVGIACSLLIYLHVKDELSYENAFPKAERIYRITIDSQYAGGRKHWANGPPLLAPLIKNAMPEIEEAGRLYYASPQVLSVNPGEGEVKRFEERRGFFADPVVLAIFDLRVLEGDAQRALADINSVVLTAGLAEKYFGTESPIGKTIMLDNFGMPARVTAVIEDLPRNSHLEIDYLMPFELFYTNLPDWARESRTWKAVYTYVLLRENAAIEQVEAKLYDFMMSFYSGLGSEGEILARRTIHFQPITDIHLRSRLEQEMGANSDIAYVYIFSFVAVLLLLIAGVNFVNISTAHAFKRMREVGMRKVLGAQRRQLVRQFLGEAFVLILSAAVLALVLCYSAIPLYNSISGKSLHFGQIFSLANICVLAAIILMLGLMAGSYPALFMANFTPITSLKSLRDPHATAATVRKALVWFQFVISIFLIFSTITIYTQMRYFHTKDLGFDEERLVAIKLYGDLQSEAVANAQALKDELLHYAAVAGVTLATNLPGERLSVEFLQPKGASQDEALPTMRFIRVDEDFIKTMGITLKEGSDFQGRQSGNPSLTEMMRATLGGKEYQARAPERGMFILNEIAAEAINLEHPIGAEVNTPLTGEGEIIGIVEDFHFASLHNVIEPLVMEYKPEWGNYLIVRTQGGDIEETLNVLREKLNAVAPGHLFNYSFIADDLSHLYQAEDRASRIFRTFSFLAIFISCLGLFGLTAYSAELRVKEIGVRKVLGATTSSIVLLLSRTFVIWILVADVVACAIAFFAMQRWLQNFAYRTEIGAWIFVLSTLLALAVTLLTVSYQSLKAALANPVESLRSE